MKKGYIATIVLFVLFWIAVLFVPGEKAVFLAVPTLLASGFIGLMTTLNGDY